MDVQQWWDYANSILPIDRKTRAYSVNDTAYDSLREKFYYDVMAPQLASQGLSPAASKEAFMKATGRPGRSAMPRAELFAKSAVKGLMAPIAGLTGTSKELNEVVESASREAGRQNIGPIQQTAIQMGGEIAGMAPYFASPTMAARNLGQAIAGPLGRAMLEVPTVGAIQGLYDAAKADDGHRLSEGVKGFAIGAGLAAGVEGASLWRNLRKIHNIEPSEAKAIEDVIRGTSDEVQDTIAQAVVTRQPEIGNSIEQWVTEGVRKAKAMGQPLNPPEVTPDGKLWLQMKGADGKPYNLTGLGGKDLDAVMERINTHLERGGEIIHVNGSQENINRFYHQLDRSHDMDLPINITDDVEGIVRVNPHEPPAVPDRLKLRRLSDGSFLDRTNGKRYGTMEEALEANGIGYEKPPVPPTVVSAKETPLAIRGYAENFPQLGVTIPQPPGQKPHIIYGSGATRGTIFHENLHGHFDYLGITEQVNEAIGKVPLTQTLANALTPEMRKAAGGNLNEEVATYLTSAVRTNDTEWLQRFVDADGDLETVMTAASNVAETVKTAAMQAPDSLHQRLLIRKMNDVQRRAGTISDLEHVATQMGKDLTIRDGKFTVADAAGSKIFNSRDDLLKYVNENWTEPISAPNLLDESSIPDSVPRFAMRTPKNPPITTLPPLPPSGRVQSGASSFSAFFRPFYAWVQTVANKNRYPELYDVFKSVDNVMTDVDTHILALENKLSAVLTGIGKDKRKGLYTYLQTPTPAMAKGLNLSAKDVQTAQRLLNEVIEPIGKDLGFTSQQYFEYVKQSANGKVVANTRLPQDKIPILDDAMRNIDIRDSDALHVTHGLLRESGRMKYLEAPLQRAEAIVNAKTADGEWVLGNLRPIFKRHIEFMRSQPDHTQFVLDNVMGAALETWNNMVAATNAKLPKSLQVPLMSTSTSRDAFGRFMLFSYAGTMGLRPMALIRDSLQLFTTTLPILGPKYTMVGMNKAFGKGASKSNIELAKRYGAWIERSDIQNLYAAGNESLGSGTATKAAEKMLKPMQFVNNANRLVSFFGHSEKAYQATLKHRSDPKTFLRESGLIYADKGIQDQFLKALPITRTVDQIRDFSYKIGKELTDVSQWNYRKGAHPMMYKYAMGRLLGQYGTWPMNYLEYGRRLWNSTSGDKLERARVATTFALAHGTILKAGEGMGIDTASWVFSNPLSYGGSPLLTAGLSVLPAMDTQSSRGEQARRELSRMPSLAVPGGLAMDTIYEAVTKDDPELWKIILGFNPLEENEQQKGLHGVL